MWAWVGPSKRNFFAIGRGRCDSKTMAWSERECISTHSDGYQHFYRYHILQVFNINIILIIT